MDLALVWRQGVWLMMDDTMDMDHVYKACKYSSVTQTPYSAHQLAEMLVSFMSPVMRLGGDG
jgi:hypothetical protein